MRIHSRSLGVYVPGLNEFVRANWTIPENPFLGPGMAGLRRRGVGDFVNATFTLPPQPAGIGRLRRGLRDFVPATFTLPPQPAGIGDFVGTAAMYPIPPNSVTAGAAGLVQNGGLILNPGTISASFGTTDPGAPSGVSGLGCAGGPGHECSDCKSGKGCGGGLGQAMTDFGNTVSNLTSGNMSGAWTSFLTFLSDPVFGTTVPIWMVGGGVLLAYALFFSGGSHSRYQRSKKASAAARRAYA